MLAARWLSFNVVVLALSLGVAVWHLTIPNVRPIDFVALDRARGGRAWRSS